MVNENKVVDKEALLDSLSNVFYDVMKVSESSIEASAYVVPALTKVLDKAKILKLERSQNLLKVARDLEDFVRLKLTATGQPWAAIPGEAPGDKTVHENLAIEAADRLTKILKGDLKLDIAISDHSEILRGYTLGDTLPEAGIVKEIDTLFNSWLVKNNMSSRNSTLLEADDACKIRIDINGNPVLVNVEKMKNLINDPHKGFASYMADKKLNIAIQQHEYPTQKMEEEKQQAVKQALEEARKETSKVDAKGPDEPHTTLGGSGAGG